MIDPSPQNTIFSYIQIKNVFSKLTCWKKPRGKLKGAAPVTYSMILQQLSTTVFNYWIMSYSIFLTLALQPQIFCLNNLIALPSILLMQIHQWFKGYLMIEFLRYSRKNLLGLMTPCKSCHDITLFQFYEHMAVVHDNNFK